MTNRAERAKIEDQTSRHLLSIDLTKNPPARDTVLLKTAKVGTKPHPLKFISERACVYSKPYHATSIEGMAERYVVSGATGTKCLSLGVCFYQFLGPQRHKRG